MRKSLLLIVAVLAFAQLYAQTKTVTGKVTDQTGGPVPNASVTVKNSSIVTSTDANGAFSITVPTSAKALVVTAVGMSDLEVNIGNRTSFDLSMKAEDKSLAEVVVVGYGTKSVRENTGAVSKVKGGDIANIPLPTFDQAMGGKTAGVQITTTGGLLADGVAIRVRGVNSISSSSQPLVVIDGIPQIALTNLSGFNGGDGTRFNPFALINANDIESIDVLKDAGAAAIYGSRAANGVILITTKKGKKGSAKVTFDAKFGWARANKLPQLLNGDDFITIQNEKAGNRYGVGTANGTVAKESDLDGDGKNDRTNWLDYVYKTGFSHDYNVSYSGGAEKASYYASARYVEQEGITYGNKLTTGQARLNIDITPKTWFKSGIELSYTKTLNNGVLSDRYLAGTVTSGWQAPPTVPVYVPGGPGGFNLTGASLSPTGILNWGNNTRLIGGTLIFPFNYYNPIAAVDLTRNNNTAEDLRANMFGEITVIKGLKLTSKFGIQYLRNFEDQYTSPLLAGLGLPYNGLVQDQDQQWKLWLWQNYLSYDKTIAHKHRIGFVGGAEFQKDNYFYLYTGAANFSDPFFKYVIDNAYTNVQPGTTTTLNLTGGNKRSSGIESYFSRLNYSFDGKYQIEGSFRGDSYSGFGQTYRWGYFPSVAVGWEITKENFMQSIGWIDFLKLRGSYGKVGNSRGVSEYASKTLYGGAAYTITTGLGYTQQGNSFLRWESSNKTDVGIEANFLKNKLGVVIDYFNTNIDNLILAAPVLYTVGVPGSSISTNIGGMYNRGLEITINAKLITTKDFSWTTSFNFTTIKNKVTGLLPSNNNADIASGLNVASLGKALGTFFLPNWAGVDPTTGNPQWYAKDGTIKRYNLGPSTWTNESGTAVAALGTADYVYQDGKTGLPKWYGGWDNRFSYKNWDLSVSIMYQGGNYLFNGTRQNLLANTFSNNFAEIKNRWQKAGDKTDIAKLWLLDNTANTTSTRFLEKADFLRVRVISISYNINKSILDRIGFDGLRVYGQVFNAFTLTNYSGVDPEVNTNRFDNISIGLDTRNVPQSRTVTFGIQASF